MRNSYGVDDEQDIDPDEDDDGYDGDVGHGGCIDCGEPFRYDDVGGYNPPCRCGLHCRSCHEAEEREASGWDDDDRWEDDDA